MTEADTTQAGARRLYFALWPDETLRRDLHALGGELLGNHHGRRLPAENLHLTLAFLGYVDAARQGCLEREASAVQLPALTLTLDQAGFWPRKGILWVGGTPPERLLTLVAAVNGGLRACGVEPVTRPFQVHLTLARNVSALRLKPDRAVSPLAWKVDRFALVASQTLPTGARYEVLHTWPLLLANS